MSKFNDARQQLEGNVAKIVDSYGSGAIYRKPIGIAANSYGILEQMLYKNIGSKRFGYDGYGSVIGEMSNPYWNEEQLPWFKKEKTDEERANYLDYINATYFHGTMLPPNFHSTAERIGSNLYNEIINFDSEVGGMHHYNLDATLGARMMIPNGATNPNGYDDTYLGILNNLYLSATLFNSEQYANEKESEFKITQKGYESFGLRGRYGINDSSFYVKTGTPVPNETYLNGVISSTPMEYDQNFDISTIKGSTDLFKASSDVTQMFITKSILGYDLLSNNKLSLEGNNIRAKKKYFPCVNGNNDYVSQITAGVVGWDELEDLSGRSIFARISLKNAGNGNVASNKIQMVYDEELQLSPFDAATKYKVLEDANLSKNDIIKFTNNQFRKGKYQTLIARFSSGEEDSNGSITSSAVSQYGLSRGRNLLKKGGKIDKVNGMDDPYCRVWTYHKQYSKMSDLIRPFSKDNVNTILENSGLQNNRSNLINNGVKTHYGLVRFAPSNTYDIKRCMFSIENLAWRNTIEGTSYYKGPNGGRIMWFPPYDLKFNEQVSANWNATQFIGRGEKIYSYVDSERNGTLSFKMLIDHPSLLDKVYKKNVDAEDSENDVLRFFAGCNIMSTPVQKEKKEEVDISNSLEALYPPENKKFTKQVKFSVYFPNCYSGIDDGDDAISYLLLGRGCKKGDGVNEPYGYEISTYGLSEGVKCDNFPYYRIDKECQMNTSIPNTIADNTSYRLNDSSSSEDDDDVIGISFTDICRIFSTYDKNGGEESKRAIVNELLRTYKVKSIKVIGYSYFLENDGDSKELKNELLAQNRAKTIVEWLKKCKVQGAEIAKAAEIVQDSFFDMGSKEVKQCRKCDVTITFEQDEIISDLPFNISSPFLSASGNAAQFVTSVINNRDEGKLDENNTQEQDNTNQIEREDDNVNIVNEYEFFQQFSSLDSILRHRIVDKIQYFDPAFHSITPEGFNARLTFLHQCTRQGQTYSASDTNRINIRNLSFGAPPICVLRIGDFYNTKIIIKSIDISYDEATWDLNDEGIGVMPMMADINMSFTFIGGSDLSGPISRLQNAVSFNYYANTSVYENNSDKKLEIEDDTE